MSMAPAQVIDPIKRTPVKYDLLSAATLVEPDASDVHWENGVTWTALGSAPASGLGERVCPPGSTLGLPFTFRRGAQIDSANPFTVWHDYECSPAGHGGGEAEFAYAEGMATDRLKTFEMAKVEEAIWTGNLHSGAAGPQGFADTAVILDGANTTGTSLAVRYAIAALEEYISSVYGSQGVIHMGRAVANIGLADFSLDTRENDTKLVTQLGTPVAAGRGYHGLGPAMADPGVGYAWIFATPAIEVIRSNVVTFTPKGGGLTQKNDLVSMAQRQYVVRYDGMAETPETSPCAGVLVNLTAFA